MEQKENFFTESGKKVEEYIQNRILLIKLQLIKKLSNIVSRLFAGLVIAFLCFIIIIFLSIVAGYFFSELTGSLYIGFGIVCLFYIVLLVLVIIFKKSVIENLVADLIVKIFLDKNDDDEVNS
jgi:low affinity Fe/Cu permease